MTAAMVLRSRLVPYLYTMAYRSAIEGRALVEPMYYQHPGVADTYKWKNAFRFGNQLVVGAITEPADRTSLLGRVGAWVPEGLHVDIFTGVVYSGGRSIHLHRPSDKIPVLASAGAIIPLDAWETPTNGAPLPESIEVMLVLGANGEFVLVEDQDDNKPIPLDEITFAKTPMVYDHAKGVLTIGPAKNPILKARSWSVRLPGANVTDGEVDVTVDGGALGSTVELVESGTRVTLAGEVSTTTTIEVHFGEAKLRENDTTLLVRDLLDPMQVNYTTKEQVWNAVKEIGSKGLGWAMSRLSHIEVGEGVRDAVTEILLARV